MFVFQLDEAEANLLVTALAELPFKTSAALIGKLQVQAKEQTDSKPSDAEKEPERPFKMDEVKAE